MYEIATVLATGGSTVPSWISSLDFSSLSDTAVALAGAVSVPIVAILAVELSIKLLKKFGNKIG